MAANKRVTLQNRQTRLSRASAYLVTDVRYA
jgi:hypothetical protein